MKMNIKPKGNRAIGTIALLEELHQVAGHDPEAYSPMHEARLVVRG